VGEPHGRLQGLVEYLHPMVRFERGGDTPCHADGIRFVRLVDLDDLETPGEGEVLFDVLFVLAPGGGGDGAQGAPGQGRFEQIGRVAGAGGTTRTDQGMGLVDEQDDGRR